MAIGRKVYAASELGLERVEEGFGMRVITRSAHVRTLREPEREEAVAKRSTHVLRSAIAVKDHALGGSVRGGFVERSTDDGGGAASGERPSEDAAGVLVHHNRQVAPAAIDF